MKFQEFVNVYQEAYPAVAEQRTRKTVAEQRLQNTMACVTFLGTVRAELGINVLALPELDGNPLSPRQISRNFARVHSGQHRAFGKTITNSELGQTLNRIGGEIGSIAPRQLCN